MEILTIYDLEKQNIKAFNHYDIDRAITFLGISLTAPAVGITVSLPTKLKIPLSYKRKLKVAVPYEMMTPVQQMHFIVHYYLPKCITPYVRSGLIVPELTKNGNVHVHILAQDPVILNRLDLQTLRTSIAQSVMVRKVLENKPSVKGLMTLNYIHFLESIPDWITYLKKDLHIIKDRLRIYGFGSQDPKDPETLEIEDRAPSPFEDGLR